MSEEENYKTNGLVEALGDYAEDKGNYKIPPEIEMQLLEILIILSNAAQDLPFVAQKKEFKDRITKLESTYYEYKGTERKASILLNSICKEFKDVGEEISKYRSYKAEK